MLRLLPGIAISGAASFTICEPEFRPASAIGGSRRLCWREPAGDLFIVALTGRKISVGLRTN